MANVVDLRSDTVTKPVPEMLDAMMRAEVGDDVFGDDPTAIRLERKVAEMLGHEAALFFPSGVMSNQVAIKVHTEPGDEMICDVNSHINYYESGGPAVHSQVMVKAIEGHHGFLTADMVRRRIRDYDIHQPRTRLLCLENTHNRAGGRVYPPEMMRNVAQVARENDIRVHLDGARIFNAAVARGIPVTEWTALADTVNICLSKGLGAPVGSMLAGSSETIQKARWTRKQMGGGMRQVGILAAAGIYALDHHIVRLAEDHANARKLAESLADLPGLQVRPAEAETNIVLIHLADDCRYSPPELLAVLAERGVMTVPFGRTTLRAVTHLGITADDIDQAAEAFHQVLAG